MLAIPTAPWAHYIGDGAAWACGALAAWAQHRAYPAQTRRLAKVTGPGYYQVLAISALAGAWLLGSLNTVRVGLAPSHSIAGALAGGIFGVELWKWRQGIRGSTGGAFVLPLAVGIMIGRLGCLFAGLPDLTYGVHTTLPWAVNLGDGVGRHPVQLYESLATALFLAAYIPAKRRGASWATRHAFHAFVIFYAVQRFAWEFLKPYPTLIGPLNLFHLLCLGLIAYGIFWWRRDAGSAEHWPTDHGPQGGAIRVPQPDDEPVRNLP